MAHETPTLTIRNRLKTRPLTFELTHDAVCLKSGDCTCSRQLVGWQQHDTKTGERPVRGKRVRVGRSIHLLARGTPGGGDEVADLPLAAKSLPDIAAAERRGDIVFVEVSAEDTAKAREKRLAKASKAEADKAAAFEPKAEATEAPAKAAPTAKAAVADSAAEGAPAPNLKSAPPRAKE